MRTRSIWFLIYVMVALWLVACAIALVFMAIDVT